ncbi:Tetraketide alpha-pyrone reductase 1 [Morella rubra]|uniref:Tetraketide alpha-pyrone reductase 1 n=1 Tax=Morella rubra TaxID=262757 RepID=A0A6A1WLY9_9ROSI|nr:Tetraketide alpha-pyrone reductase 1 [Morella rubra]
MKHLFLECKVSYVLWREAPWPLMIDRFVPHPIVHWISVIIDPALIDIPVEERHHFQLYAANALDVVWFERNRIVHGKPPSEIPALLDKLRRITQQHVVAWRANSQYRAIGWLPPPPSFAMAACVCCDFVGTIIHTETKKLSTVDPLMIQRKQSIYLHLMERRKDFSYSKQICWKKDALISLLKDAKSELIDPAVKGTLNVLRSCAKVPSIKRVVITASVASVMFNGKPLTPDVVIDETWFSDTVRCEELKNWYAISKTLAEESAWKFSEDHGIDLVAICPGFVIGPLLQPAPTSSIEGFLNLVKGTQTFPDGIYRFVDIRNVVDVHIQAFETPAASGRYCVVGRVVHYSEAFKILQKICPSLHLPEKFEDDKPSLPVYKVSQDRARSLGINFIPLELEKICFEDSLWADSIQMSGAEKVVCGTGENDRMSGTQKVVCVTGGSGYVASWLKTEHLLALDGAKERLQLFKADLLEEGCFDPIVEGCQGVFHTASPVFFVTSNPQSELIDPAVKGTLNVLRSCAKAPSVKRVVITASISSVMCHRKPLSPEVVLDETWFSDTVRCEELKNWYALSKTLAEESAWKFSEDHGIDLVTICPGFCIGPLIQPAPTFSIEAFLKLVKEGIYVFVDIRDVVDAHILAFETPTASGRYCVVGRVVHYSEAFKILQKICPSLHLPEKGLDLGAINIVTLVTKAFSRGCAFKTIEDDKPSLPVYKVSQDRARSLGINFIPLEVSLGNTVESLKEKGFLIF